MPKMRDNVVILPSVRVEEFDYELPRELIAQAPLEDRAGSRMLVVERAAGRWRDALFREFPLWMGAGDCLVANDSRVIPSRVFGEAAGRGKVEVLLLEPSEEDSRVWEALVKPARRARRGSVIRFAAGFEAEVTGEGERGLRFLRFSTADVLGWLEQMGHVPLPPYITRQDREEDRERYQTVFAREPGSAAAPTAGLHFTAEIIEACQARGTLWETITLHVGLGTFRPLEVSEVEQIRLHSERYWIGPEAWRRIVEARRRVAVGTTSVRTLETAWRTGQLAGRTELFIAPGFEFQATGALLTNFHLPRSSLLMLVCAFGGKELILEAYRHAVREGYRFYSYGDCMLII